MRFKDLGISIDLAKSLYELGVRCDSALYWYQEKAEDNSTLFNIVHNQNEIPWKLHVGKPSWIMNQKIFQEISAYCCNELGEMLPGFIEYNGIKFYLQLRKDDKKWAYFYAEDNSKNCLITASGRTEQNARASLLIGILKTKLIDVSQTIIK